MAGLPPPPPGLDIHASRQSTLYAAGITTEVLALVTVILRLWCRKITKSGYRLDDWLIVAAAVSMFRRFWLYSPKLTHVKVLSVGYMTDTMISEYSSPVRSCRLPRNADRFGRKVVKKGGGLHLWVQRPNFVTDFFRGLFISEILYFLLLCTVKFSILAFYRRIFITTIMIPVYILASLVLAWGIAVVCPVPWLSMDDRCN